MIFAVKPWRRWCHHRGLWILLFLLAPLQPAQARTTQLGPQAAGQPALIRGVLRAPADRFPPPLLSTPLLAESWGWRKPLSWVESALNNRRRMIQLAMVGMCIGLYILMRR
jgi:hypothetical protein